MRCFKLKGKSRVIKVSFFEKYKTLEWVGLKYACAYMTKGGGVHLKVRDACMIHEKWKQVVSIPSRLYGLMIY